MNKTLFLCLYLLFIGGCSSAPKQLVSVSEVGIHVRTDMHIYTPENGEVSSWSKLMVAIDGADIVLLGELHDHAVGHAVQLAVVVDVMDSYPQSVLALEMLERDEQLLVDDFMEGLITSKTFATLTQSENWGGSGGWSAWYQPIIDAVKDRGGSVVAANAPRRYVRLARTGGYDQIDALPVERRVFIDYPESLSGGRYRQRFWELASHNDDDDPVEIDVATIDLNDPVLKTFRSMQAWDATMAQSVVSANPSKKNKVLLLVGQFHVEYDGGIVQEIRARMPNASIVVVSIQREIPNEDWRGDSTKSNSPPIADFMIVENK